MFEVFLSDVLNVLGLPDVASGSQAARKKLSEDCFAHPRVPQRIRSSHRTLDLVTLGLFSCMGASPKCVQVVKSSKALKIFCSCHFVKIISTCLRSTTAKD